MEEAGTNIEEFRLNVEKIQGNDALEEESNVKVQPPSKQTLGIGLTQMLEILINTRNKY